MRKRRLSLGLALVLCLGLAIPAFAAGQTFADVPAGHWAYERIERAYGEGAISGTSYNDKTGVRLFSPDSPLTGVEFTAMLCKRYYPEAYAEASGMPENGWNDGARVIGARYGLVSFAEASSARFQQPLTRYRMAEMIVNLLEAQGTALPSASELQAVESGIWDWDHIPEGFRNDVASVFYFGIVTGVDSKGSFSGDSSVSRAQGAVILTRLGDTIDKPPAPQGTGRTLSNGKAVTEENVLEIMRQVEREYPSGMSWGPNYTPNNHYYPNGDKSYDVMIATDSYVSEDINGTKGLASTQYACGGFAAMLSDRIFGQTGFPARKLDDESQVRPGDIVVHLNEKGNATHFAIATSKAMYSHNDGDPVNGRVHIHTADGNVDEKVLWSWHEPELNDNGLLLYWTENGAVTEPYITCEFWTRYPA